MDLFEGYLKLRKLNAESLNFLNQLICEEKDEIKKEILQNKYNYFLEQSNKC